MTKYETVEYEMTKYETSNDETMTKYEIRITRQSPGSRTDFDG
jgi:hypothetical protein